MNQAYVTKKEGLLNMKYQVKCKTCNKVLDQVDEPYIDVECMSCIENNLDIVVVTAPKEIGFFNVENKWTIPHNYLIENVNGRQFLIHRELSTNEVDKYEDARIFVYKSKKYLSTIASASSRDDAELRIKSFWDAFKDTNDKKEGN